MTRQSLITAPSCDTLVALGARSANGATIFAKNSDRPGRECQPQVQMARMSHAPGARVRCQYIEIPQVEQTWSFSGSRPAWLWGLEHGVNEHGVAIGNEALITREQLPDKGLLGMDLVRLGLERAASAHAAMETIGALIERWGQGGSSACDFDWRYSNGFLIADHAEAWTLESSGRQWAARRIGDCGAISNRIGTTGFERASADVREHARERGWWDGRGTFDFGAVYSEESHPTTMSARARIVRSRELLARAGRRSLRDMFAILRDHYEMGEMPVIAAPLGDDRHFSICMHTDFIATTASMVAELSAPDSGDIPVMWASMAAPCTGVFVPLYPIATIPAALTVGAMEPSHESLWWRMKAIQDRVAEAPERLAPIAWKHLRPLEERMIERAAAIALKMRGRPAAARAERLTAFMAENLAIVLEAVGRVEAELAKDHAG